MCQSKQAGGKRCAAHTRPVFEKATFGTSEWDAAAADYARTNEGRETITAITLNAVGDRDFEKAAAAHAALKAADRADQVQVEFNRQVDLSIRRVTDCTSANDLRGYARHKDPRILAAVARNGYTPEDVLEQLASTGPVAAREAMAFNTTLSEALQVRLATDQSRKVTEAMSRWHNRPHAVVTIWAADRDLRRAAASAATMQGYPDVLEGLADDESDFVRNDVARAGCTPLPTLRRLLSDPDLGVAATAMCNRSMPAEDVVRTIEARAGEFVAEDNVFYINDAEDALKRVGRPDLIGLLHERA